MAESASCAAGPTQLEVRWAASLPASPRSVRTLGSPRLFKPRTSPMKKIHYLALLAAALSVEAVVFVSCGTFDAVKDSSDASSTSTGGSGVGGAGSGGSSGGSSGSGSLCAALECNGTCVDPNTDNANCG